MVKADFKRRWEPSEAAFHRLADHVPAIGTFTST